ncbi:MAG: T9SS type A sorting domain-containing protein [Chitinophagaceae bacterium]|nr:T9SS type A sorting domain-containing protein [Chitinophagaceae bacterium]
MFIPVRAGIALVMLTLSYKCVFAQCSSTSFLSGSTFATDFTVGSVSFTSTGNAAASDDNYASATPLIPVVDTRYLKATGFGFTVPTGAVICGVEVELERSAAGITLAATIDDNDIRIVKGGTVTGSNRAAAGDWTLTDVVVNYGSSSDLWGTTLTPAEVNNSGFGVAVSAGIHGVIGVLPTARIDRIRIRVYYNVVTPLLMHDFRVEVIKDLPVISCTIQNDENEEANILIERSIDQKNWKETYSADHLTHGEKIGFTDNNAESGDNYYRLKLIKHDMLQMISAIKKVTIHSNNNPVLYPNPAGEYLYFQKLPANTPIHIYDQYGRKLTSHLFPGLSGRIFIGNLLPGIYYLKYGHKQLTFIKIL